MSLPGDVHAAPDPEALARAARDWLLGRLARPAGPIAVCLSGGSTPRRLYELLAEPEAAARVPWARVHWFWGDERFVAPDDPMSNWRMADEALFAHVPVPPANLHPITTAGLAPDEAARTCERDLRAFYGATALDPARPLFDATLLGLGEDGHTASLFPDAPVLSERTAWAVPSPSPRGDMRITLTYPVLESSRAVAFLVAGAAKRPALTRIAARDRTLPAARLRPVGETHWFADAAALSGGE